MSTSLKKLIRIATYGFIITIGFVIAFIPFLKKKEYTNAISSDFSPDIRDVHADIPWESSGDGDGDGGDDGGGI